MMIALISITLAMVAWKYRQWHDELWGELTKLQKRIHQLEIAVIKDECRRNEYAFTTRTAIDMEAEDVY